MAILGMEEKVAGLESNFDPKLQHVTADEEASPEEEALLMSGMESLMEFMFSEEGMAGLAQVLQQDQRPLMEKVPDILEPLLTKVKQEVEQDTGRPLPASVFYGDGGLMTSSIELIFDLAQQLGVPGAEDSDQYAASLMGLYKKAGEHVLGTGDQDARDEAVSLASDMVLTQPDGSMMDPNEYQKQYGNQLSQDIGAGIESMGGGV